MHRFLPIGNYGRQLGPHVNNLFVVTFPPSELILNFSDFMIFLKNTLFLSAEKKKIELIFKFPKLVTCEKKIKLKQHICVDEH